MAIKKLFFLIFISLYAHHNAQTYVKVNGFTLPALMLNAGIETKLTDKTLLTQVTQLCLEGIKKEENSQNTDTLANVYYKLGDNKNAKFWAKKSIEIAKAKGDEYTSTEELLKKIK